MYNCVWFLFFIFNIVISEALQFRITNNCSAPTLVNGRVRFRGRSRKFAKFICDKGFEISGNRFATCIGGQWDNPRPICVRQGCDTPTHLENGIVLVMRNEAEVMFFCTPGHKLVGSSTIYCDGVHWNDTVPECIDVYAPPKLSCDFESQDLCGWTDDELHDFDWRRLNKKTPSSFLKTGPSTDHTPSTNGTGYYMYIESTSRRTNETARLISPVYSGSLAKNGCFSFYYHMYGEYIGGLRVYQKPELYPLSSMLSLSGESLKKYLLFEKWGNQGDFWYGAVNKLSDFSDNFQIIIEGIRGLSFTSDIAIDDVAILQGEDACHAAEVNMPTPNPILYNSCSGRCDFFAKNEYLPPGGCSCSAACTNNSNCCADFYEACLFDYTSDYDMNSGDRAPQTEKLVATKPTSETTETTEQTKTTKLTATKLTTTELTTTKLTTTNLTTTVSSPKKFHLIFKTTPEAPLNGGVINVSKASTSVPSTTQTTKATSTTELTPKVTTTPIATTTPTTPTTMSTPNLTESTTKAKMVVQKNKLEVKKEETKEDEGSSSTKIIFIIIGVLVSISACVYIVYILRGSKAISTIAIISRTARNDPEVTFLTRNEALEDD